MWNNLWVLLCICILCAICHIVTITCNNIDSQFELLSDCCVISFCFEYVYHKPTHNGIRLNKNSFFFHFLFCLDAADESLKRIRTLFLNKLKHALSHTNTMTFVIETHQFYMWSRIKKEGKEICGFWIWFLFIFQIN